MVSPYANSIYVHASSLLDAFVTKFNTEMGARRNNKSRCLHFKKIFIYDNFGLVRHKYGKPICKLHKYVHVSYLSPSLHLTLIVVVSLNKYFSFLNVNNKMFCNCIMCEHVWSTRHSYDKSICKFHIYIYKLSKYIDTLGDEFNINMGSEKNNKKWVVTFTKFVRCEILV